ncbi:MAG: sterol carrier protein domain-containing protein [Phycisphaerales bacterium]
MMTANDPPIADVHAALLARRYPTVFVELHLDVRDESNPPNTGRYVLSIRNGKPTVQRGGTGRIRLDIHAFTALVHHRATPAELRQTRRLTAPDEDLAALTLAFAKPGQSESFPGASAAPGSSSPTPSP